MTPKISVIVPVYNVEKYIEKCLDSILAQTFRDFEVIVLNDGSTDASADIVREIAKRDDRIQLYEHENMGLGPTRNRGISVARGEYLSFVDSDDYISSIMLEKLYEKAVAEDADVSCGETVYVYEDDTVGDKRSDYSGLQQFCLSAETKAAFFQDYYFARVYSLNAVDKLFRTEFVKKHALEFGNNRRIFAEDAWFQLQLAQTEAKISFVPEVCYYYLQRSSSIMHSVKPRLMERHYQMVQDYYDRFCGTAEAVSLKVCGLLAINAVMSTAGSMVESDCRFGYFYKAISKSVKTDFYKDRVRDCLKYQSSQWFYGKKKQLIGAITARLFHLRLYKLAALTVWTGYKLNGKR